MKQVDTLQKNERQLSDKNRWRLWSILLLSILIGTVNGYAQTITWTMNPTLSDGNPTVYGDATRLDFSFSSNEAITNAKIVITVPQGFVYDDIVADRAGNIAGAPNTINTAGLTFTYSNLGAGIPVDLGIWVKAENAQTGDVTVAIYKGDDTTPLSSQKTIITGLWKPNIRIDMTNPTVTFTDVEFTNKTAKEFSLNVSATEGSATSLKVMLQVDAWTTLSNFKIGTETITVGEPVEVANTGTSNINNDKKYTLNITSGLIANGKLTSTSQTVSFDAFSTLKGKRPVKATWQYPVDTEYTKGDAVQTFYLGYNDVSGEPLIRLVSHTIDEASTANWFTLAYDNSTRNHHRITYRNDGTAAKNMMFYVHSPSHIEFVEKDEIECYINSVKVALDSVAVISSRSQTSITSLYYPANAIPPSVLRIYFSPEVTLPKGGDLEIVMPVRLGQIYDNRTSTSDHYMRNNPGALQFYSPQVYYAVTEGGQTQTTSDRNHLSYGSMPRMINSSTPLFVKKSATVNTQIGIIPYAVSSGKYTQEVFVRVPKWLTLTNDKVSYVTVAGTSITTWTDIPVEDKGADPLDANYKLYSWKLDVTGSYSDNATIDLTFEGDSDPTIQNNLVDNITYWVDFIINGTHQLQAITQRYQQVTLLCKQNGITLDSFDVKRTDTGYTDTDRNGYADNSTKAASPRNDLYLPLDGGELIWKATVLADGAGMDRLYLPMETTIGNLLHKTGGYFNPETNIELQIDRGGIISTETMTYNQPTTTTRRYLVSTGFAFAAGDKLTITMPFKTTKSGLYQYGHITTGCLVSNADVSEDAMFASPEPTAGLGTDKASVSLWSVGWYTAIFGNYNKINYFSSEAAVKLSDYIGAVSPLYDRLHPGGNWEQEARTDKIPYAEKITLTMPDGYTLEEMEFRYNTKINNSTPSVVMAKTDGAVTILGNSYTFDLTGIWVEDETQFVAGQSIPKRGRHDLLYMYPTVKASKNASTKGQEIPVYVEFGNADVSGHSSSLNTWTNIPSFQYIGVTSELKSTLTELIASISTRQLPLTVGNPNSFTMQNNYLYVTGDITYPDAQLQLVPTGAAIGSPAISAISGGAGYCWFKLPDIGSGESLDYILEFLYSGDKDGGTLAVYTVSEYSGTTSLPTGLTSGSLNPNLETNIPFLGASKEFKIVSTTTTLGGAITVDKTELKIDNTAPYTIQASLNSRDSKSEIVNPVMKITIPKGFNYVPNSATLYWGGSSKPLTTTEELSFISAVSNSAQVNLFDLNVVNTWKNNKDKDGNDCFMLPVKGEDNELEVYLEAEFILDCETDLFNVYFMNELSGMSVYGESVGGSRLYYTNSMAAKLQAAETFAIESAITKDVFMKDQTTSTYTVTINREMGYGSMTTEKLVVKLPKTLDIKAGENITVSGGLSSVGSISSSIVGDENIIIITFPYTEMNAMSDKKAKITYSFPLESSFDGTDATLLTDPKKAIMTYVTTEMSLPGCSNALPFPVSDQKETNILFFAYDSGDKKVSAGKTYEVTTPNTGVSGNMIVASGSPIAISGSKWEYVPATTETSGTKMITITPECGGITFGSVSFDITVYPTLEYTLTQPGTVCGQEDYTLVKFDGLLSNKVTDLTYPVTYTFYNSSDANTDKSLKDTNKVTGTVTINTSTTYWVQSYNGYEYDDPKSIGFIRNAPVSITTDLDDSGNPYYITSPAAKTLSVTASGDNITYQWYKDGVEIAGEEGNSYVAGQSGTYYVRIDGCPAAINSKSVQVIVESKPADVQFNNSSKVYYDNIPSTENLWEQIVEVSGLTYWYSTTSGGPYTNQVTSLNTVSLSAGNYYVVAKNNAGTFSDNEAVLSVELRTSVSISSVKDQVNSREVGVTISTWHYDDQETITLTISAVGTPIVGQSALAYELYKDGVLVASSTNGTLILSSPTSAANGTYTVKVTGASGTVESDSFVINVCPSVDVTGIAAQLVFCETDMQSGVLLTSQFTQISGLDYFYNTDGGNSYTTSVTGVELPKSTNTPSGLTYYIKAKNEKGTYSTSAAEIKVTVEKKTTITKVDGNEVTEGNAITIIVSATGEGLISYEWYEGSSLTPLATTTTNTYQITPSGSISADNGKVYRVVVKGSGSCNEATHSFTLKVNSSTTPPLGNNKVTWDVIGYGKAVVTADGLSITNGSHVNNGTKLVITGTTWLSNVLKSITVDGTEYSSSSVSYTVNGGDVHIVVEFLGSDPNPDPNSNAEIESGSHIWAEGGYACIYAETAHRVRIVTFNGRIVADQKLPAGESRIQLPDGYYIVTLSDGTTQKIAIRNF